MYETYFRNAIASQRGIPGERVDPAEIREVEQLVRLGQPNGTLDHMTPAHLERESRMAAMCLDELAAERMAYQTTLRRRV